MKVIVLGAGVIGVTASWYLAKQGFEVEVIDREPGPALETSFANGGQISASYVEPWSSPDNLRKIMSWVGTQGAPLVFRPKWDWFFISWCARFLWNCRPDFSRANLIVSLRLAEYSRALLKELRNEVALQYDQNQRGILHFYTEQKEYDRAIPKAALMRRFGCYRRPVSVDELLKIEPALSSMRHQLVGGIYTPDDESGDAHRFCNDLRAQAEQRGVKFRFNTTVEHLENDDGMITGVRVRDQDGNVEVLKADRYLVCLGVSAPFILRPLGINLPIYPAKGYSVTLGIPSAEAAPYVSLTDDKCKIVYSRLGNRLRVAGTAEFAGYDLNLDKPRCDMILDRIFEVFPGMAGEQQREEAVLWAGLRPTTPSNVPYIGKSKYRKLYLNVGHGTLGWTMACGSGAAIADIIAGKKSALPFPFC